MGQVADQERWPLSFDAAAAFCAPFFSPELAFFFGLQLPFSPCFFPGVGSKPGQQALASELFLPPLFFADFFPGVFFVSAPLMWLRLAAVFVFADFVAPFAGDFFAEADFFAGVFFAEGSAAVFFVADLFFSEVFFAEVFVAEVFAAEVLLAAFFVVAMRA